MKVDLLLRGGRVVTPTDVVDAEIAVSGEKIAAVLARGTDLPEAGQVVECEGRVIMPGIVDPHVHLGGGRSYEDICDTENAPAAAGGITTLLQYRLSRSDFTESFPPEREIAKARLAVDTGFHFIISNPSQVERIPEYAARFGITTFKFYMGGYPKGNPIGLEMVDDAVLYEAMLRIRELGPYAYCMVHAEDNALVLHLTEQVRSRGGDTLADYAATRPAFVEAQDIRRAVWFAGLTDCPLYIVHTTIGSALDVTTEARRDGTNVIVETCPHYLALTIDDERLAEQGPGAGLVAPPLRTEEDRLRLWQGIADGEVHTVGTDHVPIKKTGAGLWDERPGFSGMSVALPVVLTYGYLEGKVDLPTVARVMAERPARLFGYYPRKGAILPGADADLAIVDLDTERVVGRETTLTAATTAFEGVPLRGWPTMTVRRGEILFRDGEYLGRPGTGRLLTPASQA